MEDIVSSIKYAMERAVLHSYDHWKSTNPDDVTLGPEPSDEDELAPEPSVEEVWDGGRSEYVHVVTFASGAKYAVVKARSGPFVGDYEIYGPRGELSEGFSSPEKAIEYLWDLSLESGR
jgi:hypothetical protein